MFIHDRKKLLFLLLSGLLLTACGTNENTSTATQEAIEHSDSQDTIQESADTVAEETSESKAVDSYTDSFSSDDSNLKLVDLTVDEPIYDIYLENSEKIYGETIDEHYPDIRIDSQYEFANVAWYADKHQIHLQLWNINDEPEAVFYVDDSKCQMKLPKSSYAEKSINKEIGNSEHTFLIESMNIYDNYIALNIQEKEIKDKKTSPELLIRINNENYTPYQVYFNEASGGITILYNIKDVDLKFDAGTEEIIYGDEKVTIE
mgnify:FL=1